MMTTGLKDMSNDSNLSGHHIIFRSEEFSNAARKYV